MTSQGKEFSTDSTEIDSIGIRSQTNSTGTIILVETDSIG